MGQFTSLSMVVFVAVLLAATACTSTETATPEPTRTPIPPITPIPIKRFSSIPPTRVPISLSHSEIVAFVKQNPGVLDAAISKDGDTVSLVLIVRPLTNKSAAKQQGDNFVRLYKSLSDDDSPGRSIGRGKYNYLIGVYYPDETEVALGAKSRVADRITW